MNHIFSLEQQQNLVIYTEGNVIMAVRLPLRKGGEYVMREGYLSDLSAVRYKGKIRLVWHSLEHHIVLSGADEQSDRIVLSDAMNVRQYGGLRLLVKEEDLYLFYTGKEPTDGKWRGYIQKLEESQTDVLELPGIFLRRPAFDLISLEDEWIISFGEWKEQKLYRWKEQVSLYEDEQSALLKKQLEEKEQQIRSISRQYEELRVIARELQGEAKKLQEYIKNNQKGHRPNNSVLKN